tara:strand:- start:203 stop:610 length:408 start_codon:yes stop_codon:yes gene_type:complete
MSDSKLGHVSRLVAYIRENPATTAMDAGPALGLSDGQVRKAISVGRKNDLIAKTFMGMVVLRSKSHWSRSWDSLSEDECRIIRRLRAQGGIGQISELSAHFGWRPPVFRSRIFPLRRDNILVRNGALFLGPNSTQ